MTILLLLLLSLLHHAPNPHTVHPYIHMISAIVSTSCCKPVESFKSTLKTYIFQNYFELYESFSITLFNLFILLSFSLSFTVVKHCWISGETALYYYYYYHYQNQFMDIIPRNSDSSNGENYHTICWLPCNNRDLYNCCQHSPRYRSTEAM